MTDKALKLFLELWLLYHQYKCGNTSQSQEIVSVISDYI